jgi:hypothetical protein
VENLDASGMQPITEYAPARIAILALIRLVFGLLLGVVAGAVLWAVSIGDMKPTKPGDMPSWWMFLVGLGLGLAALNFVAGGVGRIASAFARDCYFRAGPAGVAIRTPKNGWFGRYWIVEHRFGWSEIEQIVYFVQRINLIPVSRELRFALTGNRKIAIERHFFSANVKELQQKLLAMMEAAGR